MQRDVEEQARTDWLRLMLGWFAPLKATLDAKQPGRTRAETIRQVSIAMLWGAVCHAIFAAAVLSMVIGMWFGMALGFGKVPSPWSWLANVALLLQFPIMHSLLLTRWGRGVLARLGPAGHGMTLATTTYAIIASIQLFALFALWTPSGVLWWQAEGAALWVIGALYAASWALLMKASWDAGAEVQSGLLGWASLFRGVKPQYPPMPTRGLFQVVRQPIYVSFALTTWLVPTWTPDQLLVALTLSGYCLIGPLAKEKRFAHMFGDAWASYRAQHPYWLPRLWSR